MTVIGITGPSGAGKGEAAKILEFKYGFYIIDADKIYHSLVSSPSACLDEIKLNFGSSVIDNSGALDRKALGKLVFGEANRDNLLLLNKITHKYVIAEVEKEIKTNRHKNINCIIDAPLLIEAKLNKLCDFTISIISDIDLRISRISKRDDINYEDAKNRIASQKNDDYYKENTDYLICNNNNISFLETSLKKILSERRVIA